MNILQETDAYLVCDGLDTLPKNYKSIYALESDILGIRLYAKNLDAASYLKNAYGSEQFKFVFEGLCTQTQRQTLPRICDLSIAWDEQRQCSYPSKEGKKALTEFEFDDVYGPYVYFKATTRYLRPRQIQLHAYYSALNILGDDKFHKEAHYIYLSALKHFYKNKEAEKPLFNGLYLYLKQLTFPLPTGEVCVSYEAPKSWNVLRKYLIRYLSKDSSLS